MCACVPDTYGHMHVWKPEDNFRCHPQTIAGLKFTHMASRADPWAFWPFWSPPRLELQAHHAIIQVLEMQLGLYCLQGKHLTNWPTPTPGQKNGFGYKIKLKRNHGNKKSIQFHRSKTRPLIFMDSLSVLFRHEVTDYLMDNICDCINLSINHSFHGVNICADYRNPWWYK